MASSKGSPGPHDRNPDRARATCVKQTRFGKPCKRYAIKGSNMCRYHTEEVVLTIDPDAETRAHGITDKPGATPSGVVKSAIQTNLKKKANQLILNDQARNALRRLGHTPDPQFDPKMVLLDTVHAAWRQRQVWESMLAAIPEADWNQIGTPPVPGMPGFSKGARVEAIQKFLSEATKVAARTSKLAIDAGIEERLVRLAEEQSALIADTVRAGIIAAMAALARDLKLSKTISDNALEAALMSAASHLRQIAAGALDPETGEPTEIGEEAAEALKVKVVEGTATDVSKSTSP